MTSPALQLVPKVPKDKLVFANTVEGLFLHALEGRVTPELRAKLAALGLDLQHELMPAYPSEMWHRCLSVTVQDLWGHLPVREGYRQLGRQMVEGYRNTVLGRAAEAMARLIGPRRTLERMNKNLRNADNFTETELTVRGPGEVELRISDTTDFPSYYQGIMEAVVETSGGKDVEVRIVAQHGQTGTFSIRWR